MKAEDRSWVLENRAYVLYILQSKLLCSEHWLFVILNVLFLVNSGFDIALMTRFYILEVGPISQSGGVVLSFQIT